MSDKTTDSRQKALDEELGGYEMTDNPLDRSQTTQQPNLIPTDPDNPHAQYYQELMRQPMGTGQVWQPHAFGGGEWRTPQVVAIREEDIQRIAYAVVQMLRENLNER